MACMTHECIRCGHLWFNNQKALLCPECGSDEIRSTFDEPTHDDDRDDDVGNSPDDDQEDGE